MPDPIMVLAGLSSLATVARFLHDFVLRGERPTRADLQRLDAELKEPSQFNDAAERSIALLSEDFRKVFHEQITDAKDKLRKRYSRPNAGAAEFEEAYNQAKYQICAVLNAIKRHNGGELPDDLKTLADEFSCDA